MFTSMYKRDKSDIFPVAETQPLGHSLFAFGIPGASLQKCKSHMCWNVQPSCPLADSSLPSSVTVISSSITQTPDTGFHNWVELDVPPLESVRLELPGPVLLGLPTRRGSSRAGCAAPSILLQLMLQLQQTCLTLWCICSVVQCIGLLPTRWKNPKTLTATEGQLFLVLVDELQTPGLVTNVLRAEELDSEFSYSSLR